MLVVVVVADDRIGEMVTEGAEGEATAPDACYGLSQHGDKEADDGSDSTDHETDTTRDDAEDLGGVTEANIGDVTQRVPDDVDGGHDIVCKNTIVSGNLQKIFRTRQLREPGSEVPGGGGDGVGEHGRGAGEGRGEGVVRRVQGRHHLCRYCR